MRLENRPFHAFVVIRLQRLVQVISIAFTDLELENGPGGDSGLRVKWIQVEVGHFLVRFDPLTLFHYV